MNKTIVISSFGDEFFRKWKYYKRKFSKKNFSKKGIKDWFICSDYCVDDDNKNDVITFTIIPTIFMKQVYSDSKRYLTKDLKHISSISSEVINYLKNNEECFSISIILTNKKLFVNNLSEMSKHLHAQIDDYKTMPDDLKNQKKSEYKRIVDFVSYIDSKNCDRKFMSHFFMVLHTVAYIMEFLIIKENANLVNWVSDRDSIISFKDGIIYDLLNALVYSLIKNRSKDYKIGLFHFNELQNFDPILRIPDIITGALSSIAINKNGVVCTQKKKHKVIIEDVIYNNPRIFINYFIWHKIYGHQEFVLFNHP